MKSNEQFCPLCHLVVAPYDPDRREGYHGRCMKRYERHRMAVMYLMALIIFVALPAFGATQLQPELSCKRADVNHLACSLDHYFGTWHPNWEVSFEGRLVADEAALLFRPVIDGEWRTIRATIGYDSENKMVFEIEARVNPSTHLLEHRSSSGYRAVLMPYHPQPEQVAEKPP